MLDVQKVKQYSVFEINDILDGLRGEYDIVRLVDVEECRILSVSADGEIHYEDSCFSIWNRKNRCANCSSYRACMTQHDTDKVEHLGHNREAIRSIPIQLMMTIGQSVSCVIECVSYAGSENADYEIPEPDEYVNTHDVLTRLYTPEMLLREIRFRLLQNADTSYLLILGNIRNFEMINRLFGVEGGNRLLTGIAELFRESCSKEEIYGRLRDDRFLLFIRKDRFDETRFREYLVSAEQILDSPVFDISIKAGIYEIVKKNLPVSIMIAHAEIAADSIRDAKGEPVAWYRPSMAERQQKDQEIVTRFEEALRNREFQVYLQPQVHADGSLAGGEALVRWLRPDGTLLLPGEFLDILQQSELLSNLDLYVWERAVQLLREWKGTSMESLYISINVDPMDFYYLDVPSVLDGLCRQYGIDPKMLRVEITETALVEDIEREVRIVERLHDLGFLVEIDDFGKGTSSLSVLKDIQADVLKIDMGFIRGSDNLFRREVILKSVIRMADNLGMETIAEGVETREQLEKLVQFGCPFFQGFYFARPLSIEDFTGLAHLQGH